jgi:hypothetical protein
VAALVRRGALILFAVLTTLFVCALARAGDWLVVNGLAQHLDPGSHCHDHVTPGFGYELEFSRNWRASIGVYDNSNCNVSAYGALIHTPVHLGRLSVGWLAGAVSGYRAGAVPAAGFAAAYERGDWGLNTIFIPPFEGSGNVLWLQAKRAW